MKLKSPAFQNDARIPRHYTGEGADISPPFNWSEAPAETRELVLICEDPDAPKTEGEEHPFVHWLIYNISPSTSSLPEGLDARERLEAPIRADQGRNTFGRIGYGGPMPPAGHGPHRYRFTLYALDRELAVPPGASRHELLRAMENHVLARAETRGTYERHAARRSA